MGTFVCLFVCLKTRCSIEPYPGPRGRFERPKRLRDVLQCNQIMSNVCSNSILHFFSNLNSSLSSSEVFKQNVVELTNFHCCKDQRIFFFHRYDSWEEVLWEVCRLTPAGKIRRKCLHNHLQTSIQPLISHTQLFGTQGQLRKICLG